MGSGRGDQNQESMVSFSNLALFELQWGPVVVTGIRRVHSRGRLSWAVAPGLISGDRVGVSA